LNEKYSEYGLSNEVIAYRSLGKANYHFSSKALEFARQSSPAMILAFDVTRFFDNLDHKFLKNRLKNVLSVDELPIDWYKIFKFMTNFKFVELDALKNHPIFGLRLLDKAQRKIGSIEELKREGIPIKGNPTPGCGIPQGTPVSAVFSNLYMIEFDIAVLQLCEKIGAFYRRYSDDIFIICDSRYAVEIEKEIEKLMKKEQSTLNIHKTERALFSSDDPVTLSVAAQYLGFNIAGSGATIRQSSLARQWRRMRGAFKRTRKNAQISMKEGRADKVWTKKLRRRFTALQFRNFSSYGRRSAKAFGNNQKILGQVRRFERAVERELQALKKLKQ
jgi:RNA-directed DNA polymerase